MDSRLRKTSKEGARWASAEVARQVEPLARQLRQHLFGDPGPRFRSMREAAAWVAAEQERAGKWNEQKAIRATEEVVGRLLNQVRREVHARPWLRVEIQFEVVRPDHPLLPAPAATTNDLRRFVDAARRLADVTGWPRADAESYLLTGQPPPLRPQWRYALSPHGLLHVNLTIFPWSLTPGAWKHLRRQIVRWQPRMGQQTARLTGKQRYLLDLITRYGPPPPSRGQGRAAGRKAYWTRIAHAWGRTRTGKRPFWNTVWKLYARFPQQIRKEVEAAAGHAATGEGVRRHAETTRTR